PCCHRRCHGFARLDEHRGVVLQSRITARIDDLDPVQRDFLSGCELAKRIRRAEKHRLPNPLGLQPRCGGDDTRIVAFRENDFAITPPCDIKSEEHTSELQSLAYLVCRLLLEKKKYNTKKRIPQQKKKRDVEKYRTTYDA